MIFTDIVVPNLGEGEHAFNFAHSDVPHFTQEDDPSTPDDESGFLADYWAVSIMDVAALTVNNKYNSTDGNNCGVE